MTDLIVFVWHFCLWDKNHGLKSHSLLAAITKQNILRGREKNQNRILILIIKQNLNTKKIKLINDKTNW